MKINALKQLLGFLPAQPKTPQPANINKPTYFSGYQTDGFQPPLTSAQLQRLVQPYVTPAAVSLFTALNQSVDLNEKIPHDLSGHIGPFIPSSHPESALDLRLSTSVKTSSTRDYLLASSQEPTSAAPLTSNRPIPQSPSDLVKTFKSDAKPLLNRIYAIHDYVNASEVIAEEKLLALLKFALNPATQAGVFLGVQVDKQQPESDSQILRTHALKCVDQILKKGKIGKEVVAQAIQITMFLLKDAVWNIEIFAVPVPENWPQNDPRLIAPSVIDVNLNMRSLLYSILSRLKTLDPETFKNNDTVKITFESLEQYPTRTINHPKRDEFIEASKALHSFRRKKIAFQGAVAAFGIWSMWGAFDPVGLMMLGTMGLIAIMTTKQLVLEGLGIWHRKKYLERATTLKQELDSEITPLFLGHDPRKSME